jgi:Tfp pilus assembly major pilin PilA
MKSILSMLSDGQGNTSMMRVIGVIIVLAIMIPKVYLAISLKQPVSFDTNDIMMIGAVIGGKLVQNTQENASAPKQ